MIGGLTLTMTLVDDDNIHHSSFMTIQLNYNGIDMEEVDNQQPTRFIWETHLWSSFVGLL